jgi:hypothetical protein
MLPVRLAALRASDSAMTPVDSLRFAQGAIDSAGMKTRLAMSEASL